MATISQSQSEAHTTGEVQKEKTLKPFVTNKDYRIFSENGRDLNACIVLFLVEMRKYANTHWQEQYHIKEPLESLEQFNRDHLLGYPIVVEMLFWMTHLQVLIVQLKSSHQEVPDIIIFME